MKNIYLLILFIIPLNGMENETTISLQPKRLHFYQPERLLNILVDYLIKHPELFEREEFDTFFNSDSVARDSIVNLFNNRKMCLQDLVTNFLLKHKKVFKRKEFQNFNESQHPLRPKIIDRFKRNLEAADLKKIVTLYDCPIIPIIDLVDAVIFSHRHLPTYQKKTLVDLLMERDDAKIVTNSYFLSCLQNYLNGFKPKQCSHWPSLRIFNKKWKMDLSLFQLVVRENLEHPLKMLLNMNIMDKEDLTGAAHIAMQTNNEKLFQLLYESSKTVKDGPLSIGFLLIAALEKRCEKFIPFLLAHEQGVKVDTYYQSGKTPLLTAVSYYPEIIQELLNHQSTVDVDTKDGEGQTPLHKATFKGNLDVMKMFLEKGANINAKDNSDFCVLHDAVLSKKYTVVEDVLKKGGDKDIHKPNKHNETPLDMAKNRNLKSIVKLLRLYDKPEQQGRWSPKRLLKRNKNTKS